LCSCLPSRSTTIKLLLLGAIVAAIILGVLFTKHSSGYSQTSGYKGKGTTSSTGGQFTGTAVNGLKSSLPLIQFIRPLYYSESTDYSIDYCNSADELIGKWDFISKDGFDKGISVAFSNIADSHSLGDNYFVLGANTGCMRLTLTLDTKGLDALYNQTVVSFSGSLVVQSNTTSTIKISTPVTAIITGLYRGPKLFVRAITTTLGIDFGTVSISTQTGSFALNVLNIGDKPMNVGAVIKPATYFALNSGDSSFNLEAASARSITINLQLDETALNFMTVSSSLILNATNGGGALTFPLKAEPAS